MQHDNHNHDTHEYPERLPIVRRKHRNLEIELKVVRLSQMPKLSATDIVDIIWDEDGVLLHTEDVYNINNRHQADTFGGRTPTQQFLQDLRHDPEAHIVERTANTDGTGELQYVFWTYRWCIDLWRQSPAVLMADNTYKTNRFNKPLIQFTGVTNLHTTFHVAWALLKNERTESFEWAIRQLRLVGENEGVDLPYVCVSDFDTAFRSAFLRVYPEEIALQLCLWHVMKNVAYNVKVKWNGTLEGTALGATIGGQGSHLGNQYESADEDQAGRMASRFLNDVDIRDRLGNEHPASEPRPLQAGQAGPNREFNDDADGIMLAWKATVYAKTREQFDANWQRLLDEFPSQQG